MTNTTELIVESDDFSYLTDFHSDQHEILVTIEENYAGTVICDRFIFDRCDVAKKMLGNQEKYLYLNCTFTDCTNLPDRSRCVNCLISVLEKGNEITNQRKER